jgi:hypothetical protein
VPAGGIEVGVVQREGEGWRLAWDAGRQPFSVLIGGDGWAAELSLGEAEALRDGVSLLAAQHADLVDQLMAEEAISLELERQPWWIGLEGDRAGWALRVVLTPGPGQRAVEGCWSMAASRPFMAALQQLHGQP